MPSTPLSSLDDIARLAPQYLVISPGPCTPLEAGVSVAAIERFAGQIPILGVCLGHQSIGQAFGGKIIHAKQLMHGKTSPVTHDGSGLFAGLPSPFTATRYHSLIVERSTLPDCLEVTAETSDGMIMGMQHKSDVVHGVQFHPEVAHSPKGGEMIASFLFDVAGVHADWTPASFVDTTVETIRRQIGDGREAAAVEGEEAVAYHRTAAALSPFSRTGLTDIADIVPHVRFLVSEGWWMTGQTILVNGGYTTK